MENEEKKSKNNIGLHIIFITLMVAIAALVSDKYRIWIILTSPTIFVIWLLWLWSTKLEEIETKIKSLEKEKDADSISE